MASFFRRFRVFAAALAFGLALLGSGSAARAEHDTATPEQQAFEKDIHDYLLAHPDVVLEVLQILRQRQQAAEDAQARAALVAHRDALVNNPDDPVVGNPDGDVTLVEFFDYNCPYCKRSLKDLQTLVRDDPGLRIVMKEFPILGPGSLVAAKAALASRRQAPEKYNEFHDAMMSSRGRLTATRIMDIAAEVGFDADRLETDMADPEIQAVIDRNVALARALGINGTPAFVVGDRLAPGAV
ncbi:MAG: DsbA family protein, partial [Alphaproteobacteria bacterium]